MSGPTLTTEELVAWALSRKLSNADTEQLRAVFEERDRMDALAKEMDGRLWAASEIAPRIKPSGHSGDEETGQHDEDCEACAWDELVACLESRASQKEET